MSPEKKSDTLSNWKWRAAAENKQLEHKEKWKQRGNRRKAILNNTTRFTTGSRVDFVIVIRDYDCCSVSLTGLVLFGFKYQGRKLCLLKRILVYCLTEQLPVVNKGNFRLPFFFSEIARLIFNLLFRCTNLYYNPGYMEVVFYKTYLAIIFFISTVRMG